MEAIVFALLLGIVPFIVFVKITLDTIRYFGSRNFERKLRKQFPQAKIHVNRPSYFPPRDTSFLVIDYERKQIIVGLYAFRTNFAEDPYRTSVSFSDIVKVEIIKDGTQTATTNFGSRFLGAAVGTTVSSATLNRAKRIAIRITVDDTFKPVHEVTFYTSKGKRYGEQGNPTFDRAVRKAVEFGAYLDFAIREAGKEQNKQIERSPNMPIPAQIAQIWQLKQEGALTREEFEKQKAKLLQS